jgi:hypothetical protein
LNISTSETTGRREDADTASVAFSPGLVEANEASAHPVATFLIILEIQGDGEAVTTRALNAFVQLRSDIILVNAGIEYAESLVPFDGGSSLANHQLASVNLNGNGAIKVQKVNSPTSDLSFGSTLHITDRLIQIGFRTVSNDRENLGAGTRDGASTSGTEVGTHVTSSTRFNHRKGVKGFS